MNEKQFLKTMIETIKYDEDIQNKDDLLGILRYSIVTFRKTDRKSTRLNSSHPNPSRMPSSA